MFFIISGDCSVSVKDNNRNPEYIKSQEQRRKDRKKSQAYFVKDKNKLLRYKFKKQFVNLDNDKIIRFRKYFDD
jgi:hypothetical protein